MLFLVAKIWVYGHRAKYFGMLAIFYRTNLLLTLGIVTLGIITPSLQITLAYIYFKKCHIWSRILNAHLSELEGAVGGNVHLGKI